MWEYIHRYLHFSSNISLPKSGLLNIITINILGLLILCCVCVRTEEMSRVGGCSQHPWPLPVIPSQLWLTKNVFGHCRISHRSKIAPSWESLCLKDIRIEKYRGILRYGDITVCQIMKREKTVFVWAIIDHVIQYLRKNSWNHTDQL